jgi:predicted acetyltransferase
MNISIELVSKDEKEILKNLLEKYNYEFSQYEDTDVNNLGLYGYKYLDHYWTEENRFAFFIKVNDKLAGFIMINDHGDIKIETKYSMGEFFVMYKYRKMGVGSYAVKYIFDKYKGKWQIAYTPRNIIAKNFLNKVIEKYTNGKYKIIKDSIEAKYKDGTTGEVLIFET